MRIVGGEAKGRKLKTLKNKKGLRPLSEQVREALFNILGGGVVGSVFIDLFAGTGAVGLEALSRGAEIAFFAENDRATAQIIKNNLEELGYFSRAELFVLEVVKALRLLKNKQVKADFIFVGAPYGSGRLEEALKILGEGDLLSPAGIVISEHHKKENIEQKIGSLQIVRTKVYGDTVLDFYRKEV